LDALDVIGFVCCLAASGFVYLLIVPIGNRSRDTKTLLWFVLVIGMLMRLCPVVSAPVLEDDQNRYSWDGAVPSNGLNPYALIFLSKWTGLLTR
jgi:hypothetical protein